MRPLRRLATLLALLTSLPASAQKMQTPSGEAPGPWLLATVGVGIEPAGGRKLPAFSEPQPDGGRVALKGIAIKLGDVGAAAVAYDLDLCRVVGAWTGKFTTPMNLMSRGEFPTALGEVAFTTAAVPGFPAGASGEAHSLWKDPRPEPFGPLPAGQARFRGFFVHGEKVILQWDIGGTEVLEMPEWRDGRLVRLVEGAILPTPIDGVTIEQTDRLRALTRGGPARWPEPVITEGELSKDTTGAYVVDTVKLPDPNPWGAPMFTSGIDFFARPMAGAAPSAPRPATGGAPTPPPGTDGAVPSKPAWDAAVCTFHGDVFLVSGLDEKLGKVTWKRFASGLYHPLGLKIAKGEIHVTCRDGLWRLRDLNGDGEADHYEAFNFDVKVTKNFHEFVFDLQTDPAGNFYFAKAGPVKNGGRGFDQITAHHGALLRVSPDGKKLDVVATGFRAPNGIGVGPRGELTSGDNEGTWTPVCKINWITPGGFYGVVPLSHRDPPPTDYDRPLCWLPKRVDNSGGSQVWAPAGWGPWGGRMLHLSYGQSSLYGVMFEPARRDALPRVPNSEPTNATGGDGRDGARPSEVQGGVTKFPLTFQSGIMRARFSPADGQLYVTGLRGWQTNGLKNGCLQRVRYTGAETRMPVELHVKKDGIELRFACSLDTQSARDPENWHLEQWRYLWSAAYGSPELSTEGEAEAPAELGRDGAAQFTRAQIGTARHDPVTVKSVAIGTDDRSVFLEIPGLRPVMQMSIKYDLKSATGAELRGEVVNTIHTLGSE